MTRSRSRKEIVRRRWRAKRYARLKALGLSTRGTPLKLRRFKFFGPNGQLLKGKARKAAYQRMCRKQFLEAGFTSTGTPRQRRKWAETRGLAAKEQHRVRCLGYNRQKYAAGLTARGKPRQRSWNHFPVTRSAPHVQISALERLWREERAAMKVEVPELITFLEREEAA